MTLGAGLFYPQAKSTFPRSYVAGISFYFNSNAVITQADNEFSFLDPPSGVTGKVTLAPEFFPWSSNAYTIDFTIIESWYAFPPGTPQLPMTFALQLTFDPFDNKPYLTFLPFNTIGTGIFRFLLPFAPPDYYGPRWDF